MSQDLKTAKCRLCARSMDPDDSEDAAAPLCRDCLRGWCAACDRPLTDRDEREVDADGSLVCADCTDTDDAGDPAREEWGRIADDVARSCNQGRRV